MADSRLILKDSHQWIAWSRKIKREAREACLWQYVDPNNDEDIEGPPELVTRRDFLMSELGRGIVKYLREDYASTDSVSMKSSTVTPPPDTFYLLSLEPSMMTEIDVSRIFFHYPAIGLGYSNVEGMNEKKKNEYKRLKKNAQRFKEFMKDSSSQSIQQSCFEAGQTLRQWYINARQRAGYSEEQVRVLALEQHLNVVTRRPNTVTEARKWFADWTGSLGLYEEVFGPVSKDIWMAEVRLAFRSFDSLWVASTIYLSDHIDSYHHLANLFLTSHVEEVEEIEEEYRYKKRRPRKRKRA